MVILATLYRKEAGMRRLLFLFACATAVVFLLGACASRLDRDYGTSVKLLKMNQTLNPDAEKNTDPVSGMDGTAAQNVMDKYQKGFEEKKGTQQQVYTLPIGATTSGQ